MWAILHILHKEHKTEIDFATEGSIEVVEHSFLVTN